MKVIIFGIGDFAKQIYYYLNQSDHYNVECFCVNNQYYNEKEFMGKKVINFDDDLENYSNDEYKFIIAVGYKQMRARRTVFDLIKSKGFELINFIHSSVNVMGKIKGEGNIVLANVIIEPFAEINNNNIIWSNSIICHDSYVGDHNFIASSVVIGGFTKVINNNFIGFNSTLKENIEVDQEVLVGAKSLVIKSPDNYCTYFGIPAKKIKEHRANGIEI